jgi:ABC-type uncharacterized transport system permease subunit
MDSEELKLYIEILVAALVLFLIGRELTCWYFKINKTLAVLEEIRDLLKYPPQATSADNRTEPVIGGVNQAEVDSFLKL